MFEKKEVTKTIFFIYILLTAAIPLNAQTGSDNKFTDVTLINDSLLLKDCLILVDTNEQISPIEAVNKIWQPLSSFKIKTYAPASWVTKRVYLQLNLINSDTNNRVVFFFPGISFRSIKCYKIMPDNSVVALKDLSKEDGYQPININSKEKQTIIVELYFTKTSFNYLVPQIINNDYLKKFQNIQYHKADIHQIVGFVLSGILLMMFFFSMANFFLSNKKEFLFNGCYTACMFLLIFFTTYFDRKSGVTTSLFLSYLSFALLVTGTIFYIGFTRKFLNTANNFPRLDKLFLYELITLSMFLLAFTYLNFFTNYFKAQLLIENITKILALVIGIIYIVTALVQNNRLFNYLAAGNAMLIFFSLISFYLMLFPLTKKSVFSSSIFYYELGIVSELLFFLMGLTYKNRIMLIESIQKQEAMKQLVERQSFETKLAVINAQQQERNRISADMHDDLGAGITTIRLYSEIAKNKLKNVPIPEIEKISFTANELLNNMSAIIWTMSSNNDSLLDMVAYIRNYVQDYFENTNINCKINIAENLPNVIVGSQIRRNVFLVVKESLNNILKHAKASNVTISLIYQPTGLSLFIQDDGIGFDIENVRRFGNGLKNMKRRMDEMNIDFSIENKNGTLITLHYSLVNA